MLSLPSTLASLGIAVSTGKVVDFRSRECLHDSEVDGALPLIYPGNVREGLVTWPRKIRKPQWFRPVLRKDESLLVPEGWYCVVKRFSAGGKEAHCCGRVVARVDPWAGSL
jgi:adenine-specific DNA-methyltransferase